MHKHRYSMNYIAYLKKDFPGGSDGKPSAYSAGDPGSIGNPLQYPCLENPMEQSMVGYSPWGCKKLDMTE